MEREERDVIEQKKWIRKEQEKLDRRNINRAGRKKSRNKYFWPRENEKEIEGGRRKGKVKKTVRDAVWLTWKK